MGYKVNIKVGTPIWNHLKAINPLLGRKEINDSIRALIKIITCKYPNGNGSFYSIPGTEHITMGRPVIQFNESSLQWELSSFNLLIKKKL